MTIKNLIKRLSEICLNHIDVKTFYLGNTWDMATGKGDIYPAVWVEQPILVTYLPKGQKSYAFSMDVLMLPANDNRTDEVDKQSQCEEIGDDLLQAFMLYLGGFSVTGSVGLTVKNINADIAAGVRLDITVVTNRSCDVESKFKEKMIKE